MTLPGPLSPPEQAAPCRAAFVCTASSRAASFFQTKGDVMAQHTPGPWWVWQSRTERQHVYGTYAVLVALADREADARLIALCPDFYDYVKSSADNGCATARALIARLERA